MIDKSLLDNHIGRLVGLSSKFIRGRLGENFRSQGIELTSEQGIIMSLLMHHEGVNQQSMSEFLFTDKTAITRWIDSLEKMGYVKRVPDKEDRRQNLIFLTDAGKSIVITLKDSALQTELDAVQGIDPQKLKTCKEVLKQLIKNLNNNIDVSEISLK